MRRNSAVLHKRKSLIKRLEEGKIKKFWDKMNAVYDKIMLFRQFTKGAQMACKDDKKLDKFEPENDNRSWTRNLGSFTFIFVVTFMIIQIISSSIDQIGTLKSQASNFSNPS